MPTPSWRELWSSHNRAYLLKGHAAISDLFFFVCSICILVTTPVGHLQGDNYLDPGSTYLCLLFAGLITNVCWFEIKIFWPTKVFVEWIIQRTSPVGLICWCWTGSTPTAHTWPRIGDPPALEGAEVLKVQGSQRIAGPGWLTATAPHIHLLFLLGLPLLRLSLSLLFSLINFNKPIFASQV